MASESLSFDSAAPATSSGVSVGINRCNCSTEVIRCLSCQRQSFQSFSGTSAQKPRPAERKLFNDSRESREGGSLLDSVRLAICIFLFRLANYRFDLPHVKGDRPFTIRPLISNILNCNRLHVLSKRCLSFGTTTGFNTQEMGGNHQTCLRLPLTPIMPPHANLRICLRKVRTPF